jgi:hypothetical protein
LHSIQPIFLIDEERIVLSVQEGAEIITGFFSSSSQKPCWPERLENLPNLGPKIEYFVKKASLTYGAVLEEPQGALRNVFTL